MKLKATNKYLCPKEGCTRGFQRHSSLEKHLTFGKCTKSVERETLINKAMIKCAATLQEGESALPTISATISTAADRSVAPPEGWALRKMKKAYRFNEDQRRYLEARFTIGQESGMKLDSEVVAKEMRRTRGSSGERLFRGVFDYSTGGVFFLSDGSQDKTANHSGSNYQRPRYQCHGG